MVDQSRQLRPGHDMSLWPHLKWTRARQLVRDFYSRVDIQSAGTKKGLTPVIAEDRLSVEFCARLESTLPLQEWSLLLGDVLHNYRSALDALAWELAHLDGNKPDPKVERRIYFPICTTRKQWIDQAHKELKSVPEDMLERLSALQPWGTADPENGIFVVLHELDIDDKHKGLLRATARVRDPNRIEFSVTLEGNAPWAEHIVGDPWEYIGADSPIEDGTPIFRLKTDVPIVEADCYMALPMTLVIDHRGEERDVFQLLDLIDRQTGMTFQLVETGSLLEAPDASPVPVDWEDPPDSNSETNESR